VKGYTASTSCTATESNVPAGYTGSGSPSGTCSASIAVGACTIVNTLNSATFTVKKDFSDKPSTDTTTVNITFSCSPNGGTASPSGTQTVSELNPRIYTVTGYTPDPTCTATESPIPAGYSSSGTCAALLSAGTCTIVNNARATVTLTKTYSNSSTSAVAGFTLSCSSGAITPSATQSRTGGGTVTWTVSGFSSGASCSVSESTVPSGYVQASNSCTSGNLGLTAGATKTCTIANGVGGRSPGFWGSQNGHAILDANNDGKLDTAVTIGGGGRSFTVTTIAQSDKILNNSACQSGNPIIFVCTGSKTGQGLSDKLQSNSLEVLAAQTLGLTYNIKFISGFAGQTLAQLGCAPPSALTSLSSSSKVEDVLALANSLIANSTKGGSTTQVQASAMNSLLTCVNRV